MIRAALGIQGQFTPSLNLDFRKGTMPAGLTFTRNSIATRFNSSGVLETVTANTPRFDYDPNTLAIKGLLIEEARTNYVGCSELNGAVVGTVGSGGSLPSGWNAQNCTCEVVSISTVAGQKVIRLRVTSPGSTSAQTFVRVRFPSTSAATNDVWTGSVTARIISISGSAALGQLLLEETGSNSSYQGTIISLPVGGNLTRFTSTRTFAGSATNGALYMFGNNIPINGTLDCTLELTCPQLEKGGFATSYIPTTTTTAVTRAADACSMSSISSWYNYNEGAFFAEVQSQATTLFPGVLVVNNGSTNVNSNGIFLTGGVANTGINSKYFADSVSTTLSITSLPFGTILKIGSAYALTSASLVRNAGGVFNTAIVAPTTNLTTLRIGFFDMPLNGYIRQIRYYPRRLPNAFLQSLTT